jgi:ribosomal protein S18 acetylase RimI-like enzyme
VSPFGSALRPGGWPSRVEIRPLTEADAAAWWTLRLRMLREEPGAFGSSYEEAIARTPEEVAARHRQTVTDPDAFLLGAWGATLAGAVGFRRDSGLKVRHKGMIWGMYVAPEARGLGLGRRLLDAAVDRARGMEGVEQVSLEVTVGNSAARALYRSCGFTVYGVEPRALKLGDVYLDEELMTLRL